MTNTLSVDTSEVVVSVVDTDINVNICENVAEIIIGDTGPQGPRGTQVLSGPADPSPIIGLIGDQYINTTTGFLFGPKTESGWGSGVQLGSGLDIADVSHVYIQSIASSTWSITNPLQFTPNIVVVDLSGNVIEGDYNYGSGVITATFSQPIIGAAYLS